MKPSEIQPGATYHNGRGEERTVVEMKQHQWFPPPPIVVVWRNGQKDFGNTYLPEFARWARGRVGETG